MALGEILRDSASYRRRLTTCLLSWLLALLAAVLDEEDVEAGEGDRPDLLKLLRLESLEVNLAARVSDGSTTSDEQDW